MLTRDEFVAEMKQRLDDWSAEIDSFEAKAEEVKDDAKAAYREQLVALRVKREEGAKKLEEIQVAGESSWERMKTESENVWEAFKDSAQAFRAHFK